MQLTENMVFAERYCLSRLLGKGAFSEVWLAHDTFTNIDIAIKVYAPGSGMDDDGQQLFARELAQVFNLNHQNLLHPYHVAVWEGMPYLTMPFCSNGSLAKQIGHMNEEQVWQLIEEVGAGLQYLHQREIVHQDIKPLNILVDNNGHFMITDFGISVSARTTLRRSVVTSSQSSGGTIAYMGPERFGTTPLPVKASDIWSFGATVFEVMTGYLPFGENGGLTQKSGADIPQIQGDWSNELVQLVYKMLAPNPWDRPKADQLKRGINKESGTRRGTTTEPKKASWNRPWVYALIAGFLLLAGGLTIGDYQRVKVRYYKDYTERWGIPQGIGEISHRDANKVNRKYKLTFQHWKLQSMEHVNARDHITDDGESERKDRPMAARFVYADRGNLSKVYVEDRNGKVLYVKAYSDDLCTIVFQYDDGYGTERPLSAHTIGYEKAFQSTTSNKGSISRYLVEYDKDGYVQQITYAGFQNVLTGDANNIYGIHYVRDRKGRVMREQYLGRDGSPKATSWGLGKKEFTYDEMDNLVKVVYLTTDGKPAKDDSDGLYIYTIDYDQYGNVTYAYHRDADGNLTLPKKYNVAGVHEVYEDGLCVRIENLGTDGQIAYSPENNAAVQTYMYDENGFMTERHLLDKNDQPSMCPDGFASMRILNDLNGNELEVWYYDLNGQLVETNYGYAGLKMTYDTLGNMLSIMMYDVTEQPKAGPNGYAGYTQTYTSSYMVESRTYLDADGNATEDDEGVMKMVYQYDGKGNQVSISYTRQDGTTLKNNQDGIARIDIQYDENGNETRRTYLNENLRKTLYLFYAVWEGQYDANNHLCKVRYYDKDGKPAVNAVGAAGYNYRNDERGNTLESVPVTKAHLPSTTIHSYHYCYDDNDNKTEYAIFMGNKPVAGAFGYHKCKYRYDSHNQMIEVRYYDTNGRLTNYDDEHYAIVRYDYDERGYRTRVAYFDLNSMGVTCNDGYAVIRQTIDAYGNVSHEWFEQPDGSPTSLSKHVPESAYEWDRNGNIIRQEIMDGRGNRIVNPATGWAIARYAYNDRNKQISISYYGITDQPILVGGVHEERSEYDDQGRHTAYIELGKNGEKVNDNNGVHRYEYIYSKNSTSSHLLKTYNKAGTRLATYNKVNGQWKRVTSWQDDVRALRSEMPYDFGAEYYHLSLIKAEIISSSRCDFTFRISYNKNNLNKSTLNDLESYIKTFLSNLRSGLNIPKSVKFYYSFYDSKGNAI